jgi:HEAT repeat protein
MRDMSSAHHSGGDVELRDQALKALSNSDPLVRLTAAMRLATLAPDDRSVDAALVATIGDTNLEVSRAACQTLIHRDPNRDHQPIVAAIRARRGSELTTAEPLSADEILEYRLMGLKSVDVASILLGTANDPDPHVRAAALPALAQTDDPRVPQVLETALSNPAAVVRAAAALGLVRFATVAQSRLTQVLRNDPDPCVRAAAAATLGSVGDDRSRDALEEATKDEAAEVRKAAAGAIREQNHRREQHQGDDG